MHFYIDKQKRGGGGSINLTFPIIDSFGYEKWKFKHADGDRYLHLHLYIHYDTL